VLGFVVERCDGMPYLARVDLLPAGAASASAAGPGHASSWTAGWHWLVSELELGWPELFLRASPGAVQRVAKALLQHLPPPPPPDGVHTPAMAAMEGEGFEGGEAVKVEPVRAAKRPKVTDG
jgi:hypothetical protein